ncbi:hypothetical protein LOTGIDRAFT_172847 [Lottia gigantea]|uniref:Uncharacterized protein n=1 Tax=Lottia gigantea TaxID=225164 RepID=V4AUL3_LOTGI|nr:hypothetical protein LOTGIDRAFT_172847 [Lottia gigantea]ESP01008.1 hypothetical protein LOTGIDRAFT_172847 [Lottia gigantea]
MAAIQRFVKPHDFIWECAYMRLYGKPSVKMWEPKIRVKQNTTGLMNLKGICIGGKIKVNKTEERIDKFIRVPSNESVCVMFRPYFTERNPLDDWVTNGQKYLIEPMIPVTSDPPVTGRSNHTSTLHQSESQNSNHTVYIGLMVTVVILFLLALVFFIIFMRKRNCTKKHFKFFQKICQGQEEEETDMMRNQVHDNNSVIITPILLQQPELVKNMVEAHLKLLEKQDGIKANPTPFLCDEKSAKVQDLPEVSIWIDEQINLALQHDNHYFIIYASENMKITFTEPDMFHENLADQICVRFIKKLTAQNFGKKVVGVCFGNPEDYSCLPFTKFHKMFSAVKQDRDGSCCSPVSFSGTINLIKHLLSSQTEYSFNSEETHQLRSIFLQSQCLPRSFDALTTGYESDSESSPFIQDNATFVGPDSIAGSQSDFNAEINGFNKRAGWPDLC